MFFTILSVILLIGFTFLFIEHLRDKFKPTKFLLSVMFIGIILNIFTELLKHLK